MYSIRLLKKFENLLFKFRNTNILPKYQQQVNSFYLPHYKYNKAPEKDLRSKDFREKGAAGVNENG